VPEIPGLESALKELSATLIVEAVIKIVVRTVKSQTYFRGLQWITLKDVAMMQTITRIR
jgi:hypothetical protein